MSHSIKTRFGGQYLNNDDLQKMFLKESSDARIKGDATTAFYLRYLVDMLESLKD